MEDLNNQFHKLPASTKSVLRIFFFTFGLPTFFNGNYCLPQMPAESRLETASSVPHHVLCSTCWKMFGTVRPRSANSWPWKTSRVTEEDLKKITSYSLSDSVFSPLLHWMLLLLKNYSLELLSLSLQQLHKLRTFLFLFLIFCSFAIISFMKKKLRATLKQHHENRSVCDKSELHHRMSMRKLDIFLGN